MNDLSTRAHVSDMLNSAADREEYNEWMNAQTQEPIEYADGLGVDGWISDDDNPAFNMPQVVQIENQLSADIARQTRIAVKKGMTLDEYADDLIARRESLLTDLQFARVKLAE